MGKQISQVLDMLFYMVCYGGAGGILKSNAITIDTPSFWAMMIILGLIHMKAALT